MESNRSAAQLNNVARGVDMIKDSIQAISEEQATAMRRQAEAQEDSLKVAKQQFLFKTAPTDQKMYGFALRPRATYMLYLLRDHGRSGDSIFGELYGYDLLRSLIKHAARPYSSSQELSDLYIKVKSEWVIPLVQVQITDALGSFGLSPVHLQKLTLEESEDAHLQGKPVVGEKVDTTKAIPVPYDQWCDVAEWVTRMEMFVEVFCRAYGERHRKGFTEALDCLRRRSRLEKDVYIIQVVHKFMFEHLHDYLNSLDDLIDKFEEHLRQKVLRLEHSFNAEFSTFLTGEDGTLEEVEPYTFGMEGEKTLDAFIKRLKEQSMRKIAIQGVQQYAAKVDSAAKKGSKPTRASGAADEPLTVRFEEQDDGADDVQDFSGKIKFTSEEFERAKKLMPRGANGAAFCWKCNFIDGKCNLASPNIHDTMPQLTKLPDELKLISLNNGGYKQPNHWTPGGSGQARHELAEKLRQAIKRKENAQKAAATRSTGRASGAKGADLNELLDLKSALPLRPGDEHELEGELFDLLKVTNAGKLDDAWLSDVLDASGKEAFKYLTDDAETNARLELLQAIKLYTQKAGMFDSLTDTYTRSFVIGHLMHAGLRHLTEIEEAADDVVDELAAVEDLIADHDRFVLVMQQGLANVAEEGSQGIDELKHELRRLGLGEVPSTRASSGRAGAQRSRSGMSFSRTRNVYDGGIGAHTFEITLGGGVTVGCVDYGTYLVQRSGEARKNACVMISAGEGLARAKGGHLELCELLESFQAQAERVRRVLGPIEDFDYITQVEREIRESVHDVMNMDHDMNINVFRDLGVDAFKDTTIVGVYARSGWVDEVRAVVGEDFADLPPARRHVVVQLYHEEHATLVLLDSARDAEGNRVDLTTPGTLEQFFGSFGIDIQSCISEQPTQAIARRGALSGTVEVAALTPCPVCALLRASGARDATKWGGSNSVAAGPRQAAEALEVVQTQARAGIDHAECALGSMKELRSGGGLKDGKQQSEEELRHMLNEVRFELNDAEEYAKLQQGQVEAKEEQSCISEEEGAEGRYLASALTTELIHVAEAIGTSKFFLLDPEQIESNQDGRCSGDFKPSEAERTAALTAIMAIVEAPAEYSAEWRELVTLAHGALLFESGSLSRAVDVFRHSWWRMFGKTIDPRRIEYLKGRIPPHLVQNLLTISEKGIEAHFEGKRQRRLIRQSKELVENADKFWEKAWEQVLMGQILLFDQSHLKLLGEIACSPILAVPKFDSLGRDTGKLRFCHNLSSHADGWSINEGTNEMRVPSVHLPTHKMLARKTLAQRVLYPGIPILGQKQDVDAAFLKLHVASSDVELYATNLMATGAELPELKDKHKSLQSLAKRSIIKVGAAITCILVYLVGTFGHKALPGEYGLAGSWPISEFHTSFKPELPSINGPFPFTSFTLVDDGALTTVDLGVRASMSCACYLMGMLAVFGVSAMNVKKMKEDGFWSYSVPIWGLLYQLGDDLAFSVSDVRIEKVRVAFSRQEWDPGQRCLTMRQLQSGVGMLRHIGQVNRQVHTAYMGLYRMLRFEGKASPSSIVDPPGTAVEKELHWQTFYDSVEFVRIQLRDPELWRTSVIAPFTHVLSVAERLSIPGEKDNMVAIGSDSTPWLLGVFNMDVRECGLIVWTKEVVEAIAAALKATGVPDHMLDEMIISCKELAAVVVMHATWGRRTRGKFYVNANDNFNAVRWVDKRVAHNPFAHHLLLILGRLEFIHGNETHLVYVNTLRNEIADYSTRWVGTAKEAKALVAHFDAWLAESMPGWTRIDVASTTLPYFITPWDQRSLALVDEVNPVPRALAAADGRSVDASVQAKIDELLLQQLGGVNEVEAHRAGVVSFVGNGASLVAKQIQYYNPTLDVLIASGLTTRAGKYLAATRNPMASMSNDFENDRSVVINVSSGRNKSFCEAAASRMAQPCLVWLHLSPQKEQHQVAPHLSSLGYITTEIEVKSVDFGEASTRTWRLSVHERIEVANDQGPPQELIKRSRVRPAIIDHLAPPHLLKKDDPCWLHSHAIPSEVFSTVQDRRKVKRRGVPRLLGHVVQNQERHGVYHLEGVVTALTSAKSGAYFGLDYYFDTRADVVAEHGEFAVTAFNELGILRRLTKYDAWVISRNPLVELLEWERRYEEDENNVIGEPTDEAIAEHLAAEPPLGLAIAVANVYGGRVVQYLNTHPRQRPPQSQPHGELQDFGEAEGFVAADFDANELMSGTLWKPRRSDQFQLNPDAAEFNPPMNKEAGEETDEPLGTVQPRRREAARRRVGRGAGLGGITLFLLLNMGMAAQAAPLGCGTGSAPRWGLSLVFVLLSFTVVTATRSASERPSPPTDGFNPLRSGPKFLEDMPRGDRRGQGVRGRRFMQEPMPAHEPPKEQARRKYRTTRSTPFSGETHAAIESEKKRLAASALSKSTIKSYDTAWRQWSDFLFNQYGQLHPFLTGENRWEDEQKGIAFVSYLSSLGRAHSTIKKKLTGIRYHHRREGLGDPWADTPALGYHLRGLKKLAGGSRSKMPATKDLLEHVSDRLNTGSVMLSCLSAAIQLAFFVLLRSSEYCVIPLDRSGHFDKESTLLDGDIMLICRGKMMPWDEVEEEDYPCVTEVVISIKKSKTDQNRVGVTRSAERTGERLCPVEAILRFVRLRLESGVGNDDEMPFFRWGMDHTQHLRRHSISKALKHSAKALGQSVDEYASHSLRIGGATALIHSGASPEAVRRFGRWKSDTWQQYSWSTRGLLSGLSKLMAKSEYTLEMSTQQYLAARRTAGRVCEAQSSDQQPESNLHTQTTDASSEPVDLEHDQSVGHYEYLVGREFYDADDDARFRVTELSEEMLAVTLTDAGNAEVSRCYVLAHYYDLETRKEYYTTAREVAVWVDETQAAAAKELAREAAANVYNRPDAYRLRAQRRIQYTK